MNSIFKGTTSKFVARKDSAYESGGYFEVERWESLASQRGASDGPYFNSGFFGFREGLQKPVGESWERMCRREYEKGENSDLAQFQGSKMIEQTSLSISVLRKWKTLV